MVFLRSSHWGAEEHVANPGLDEGEGGAVRVSGRHHHLNEEGVGVRREKTESVVT